MRTVLHSNQGLVAFLGRLKPLWDVHCKLTSFQRLDKSHKETNLTSIIHSAVQTHYRQLWVKLTKDIDNLSCIYHIVLRKYLPARLPICRAQQWYSYLYSVYIPVASWRLISSFSPCVFPFPKALLRTARAWSLVRTGNFAVCVKDDPAVIAGTATQTGTWRICVRKFTPTKKRDYNRWVLITRRETCRSCHINHHITRRKHPFKYQHQCLTNFTMTILTAIQSSSFF